MAKLTCCNCHTPYEGYKHKRSKNTFCSKSCAAQFNNTKYPKREKTKVCKTCSNKISSSATYCPECISKGKHLRGLPVTASRTIASMIRGRKDSNRYTDIRKHAQVQTKDRPKKCVICGYDKHAQTCHIKEIKEFPKTATLGEVNDPRNLVMLCMNHHWELDHGQLEHDIEDYRWQI